MKLDKEKIELLRANKCMTVVQLAHAAGISVTPLIYCKNVKPITAGKIAKALGVPVEELLAEEVK